MLDDGALATIHDKSVSSGTSGKTVVELDWRIRCKTAGEVDRCRLRSFLAAIQTTVVFPTNPSSATSTPSVWHCQVDSWGKTMTLEIDSTKIQDTFFGYVAAKMPAPKSNFDPSTIA